MNAPQRILAVTDIDGILRPDPEGPGLYLVGLARDQEVDPEAPPSVQMYARGVAVAVVEAASGVVLAWNGWSSFDDTRVPEKPEPPLTTVQEVLATAEGDPYLALLETNLRWLGTEVGRQLLFWQSSPSMTAARLIASSSGDRNPLGGPGQVVAALPLHDEDLAATVARCNSEIARHYSATSWDKDAWSKELWKKAKKAAWPAAMSKDAQRVCRELGISEPKA